MYSTFTPAALHVGRVACPALKMTFVPPPGYLPTYNPTLPFNKTIPGGLNVGMAIYIEGVTNKDTKRVLMNFALGPDPEADIAFHFNPHFDSGDKVVFNSRQSGQWGKEQMKNSFPFKDGERFELLVMVLQEHYKVTVNGNPFYEFVHRMPLQDVTHLHVHGDLTVQSINFINCSSGSSQGAARSKMVSGNLTYMDNPTFYYMPVPFSYHIQGGLTPKRTFIIKGNISLTASRFDISFSVNDTGDIALQISVRIKENLVVRNSFQNGQWGPEERDLSYNPFGPGKTFELTICTSKDGFQVYGNAQYMFDFRPRLPSFHLVDLLEITGNVSLTYFWDSAARVEARTCT